MNAGSASDRPPADPVARFDADRRAAFAAVANHLIPAAHGMPSASEVVDEARLRFVLVSRPDLVEPLWEALRPELGNEPRARLAALESEDASLSSALQLAVVGGYYTDQRVRRLIGYSGQEAITLRSWEYPQYVDEGLIDRVIEHGPVWRDPATGRRATPAAQPRSYTERTWAPEATRAGGGQDGRDIS